MERPPLILTLDLATRTGFCIGRRGEQPRFGNWTLKLPEDNQDRASRKLGCLLRDEFTVAKPDLVVHESPLNPSVKLGRGDSVNSVTLAWILTGAVGGVCGPYGVRMKRANVQTVRKAVLGTARPENPKQAALDFVNALGFRTRDDNEADAIVMWLDECGYHFGSYAKATMFNGQ